MRHRFHRLDIFTAETPLGNPAAMVGEAEGAWTGRDVVVRIGGSIEL